MRIVSLLASGTELVAALGAGAELCGRSHECDHPAWVRELPELSHPTFDISGTSGEVDRRVREKLRAGEPLYEVDEAALAALSPDVVITQTHCEVCAVAPGAVPSRERVVTFKGGSLEGVLEDFLRVATVIGRTAEGERLVTERRAHVQGYRQRTRTLPRRRVICLEWLDPPFVMGNWGPELVEAAGGTDALGRPGQHSRATTWEAVAAAEPEILVVAPCGFALPRTRTELPALLSRPEIQSLPATRTEQVYAADGNLYFNRSSPSLFDTVDLLAEILHPDVFGREREGRDYERVRPI